MLTIIIVNLSQKLVNTYYGDFPNIAYIALPKKDAMAKRIKRAAKDEYRGRNFPGIARQNKFLITVHYHTAI